MLGMGLGPGLLKREGGLYNVLSSPRDFLRPLQWSEVLQGAAGDCWVLVPALSKGLSSWAESNLIHRGVWAGAVWCILVDWQVFSNLPSVGVF